MQNKMTTLKLHYVHVAFNSATQTASVAPNSAKNTNYAVSVRAATLHAAQAVALHRVLLLRSAQVACKCALCACELTQ